MKPSQRSVYADRIEAVIRHLADLDPADPIPGLAELAALAHLSEFHFHRIYRAMTGETPAATVRRLRLARAVPNLADASGSVTAAAGAAGYASGPAFTRALKAETGMTADAARQDEEFMDALIAHLREPGGAASSAPIRVEIASFEPFEVVALRNVGDYAELNHAYSRLFEAVLAVAAPEQIRGIWGVHYDDPATATAEDCRFACCLQIDDLEMAPPGLETLTLGGQAVATAVHHGSYDDIGTSIDALYQSVIHVLGREIGPTPVFVHYRQDPEETPENELEALICLPLA